jgi:addiction module HigA family antidote
MSGRLTPVHPGFILKEDFMEPLGISQNRLSIAIGVDVRRINSIVHGNRAITTDTALRLGVYLGTGPKVWLNLQQEYDLRLAKRKLEGVLEKIEPAERRAA